MNLNTLKEFRHEMYGSFGNANYRVEEIEKFLERQFQHDPMIAVSSSRTIERYGLGFTVVEYEQEYIHAVCSP
ncbi:MAG TPA: hypothetical protein VKR06_12580 [Ktedonosporobacter sp.]|nr:hypothetical protein [Ktedonosporobacter sp.]